MEELKSFGKVVLFIGGLILLQYAIFIIIAKVNVQKSKVYMDRTQLDCFPVTALTQADRDEFGIIVHKLPLSLLPSRKNSTIEDENKIIAQIKSRFDTVCSNIIVKNKLKAMGINIALDTTPTLICNANINGTISVSALYGDLNEDELSFVIAHEIAHIRLQQSYEAILNENYFKLLFLFISNTKFQEEFTMIIGDFNYSKNMEEEADRLALRMLKKANLRIYASEKFTDNIIQHYNLSASKDSSRIENIKHWIDFYSKE